MTNFLKIQIDSNRVFGLDILRAMAILFVVFTHSGNFVPKQIFHWYKPFIYDGVGIFFVLSGFLIGGILIKQIENYHFNLKSLFYFWAKRWSRTLPNYFLFFFALCIIESLMQPGFNALQYWEYLFFLQNLMSGPPDFFAHSWSLSVEEWFYLVTPLILFVLVNLLKIKFRYIFPVVILSIIAIVTVLRTEQTIGIRDYETFKNIVFAVVYRFDSLMYGMLGAYIAYYFPKFWVRYKNITFVLFILLFASNYILKEMIESSDYHTKAHLFSLTSLTIMLSLPYFSNLKTTNSKFLVPITYISLISYSLYLANSIVVQKIEKLIDWEFIINYSNNTLSLPINWTFALVFNYLLSWVLSILIATIVYKYFEIPSTNYLRTKINISLDRKSS